MSSKSTNSKTFSTGDNSMYAIGKKALLAADLSLSKKLAFCAEQGAFRPIMKFLELSGHGVPWIAFCVYTIYSTIDTGVLQVTMNLLLALFLDLTVVGSIKFSMKRQRPIYNKQDMLLTISVDNYSFPSGHATRAAMVTYFILKHLKLGFPIRVLIRIWCFLIGLSRVILGRHHISDVLVGFVIGYLQFIFMEQYLFLSQPNCSYIVQYIRPFNDSLPLGI